LFLTDFSHVPTPFDAATHSLGYAQHNPEAARPTLLT